MRHPLLTTLTAVSIACCVLSGCGGSSKQASSPSGATTPATATARTPGASAQGSATTGSTAPASTQQGKPAQGASTKTTPAAPSKAKPGATTQASTTIACKEAISKRTGISPAQKATLERVCSGLAGKITLSREVKRKICERVLSGHHNLSSTERAQALARCTSA